MGVDRRLESGLEKRKNPRQGAVIVWDSSAVCGIRCGRGGCDGALTVLSEGASGVATATYAESVGRITAALRLIAVAAATIAAMMLGATTSSLAQCAGFCGGGGGGPPPQMSNTSASPAIASSFAMFDLSTHYLQLLGGMGGPTWQGSLFGTGPNPGGGGAPATPAPPKYRAWTELYGLASKTGAQNDFPGDSRSSVGGVAGIAMNVAPGAMLGVSVDQSHTNIDITGLPQGAKLDLTQFGVNGSYEMGNWTVSAAVIGGVAGVDSNRDTPSGPATANYHASLWGAITEAAYYVPLGSARIVPKVGADWVQTHVDAYAEAGGVDAAAVPAATSDRTRIFAGAEIGNTWVLTNTVLDLSAYARGVDIVSQHVPSLTVTAVSGPATPVTVFGVTEAQYGLETGAGASLRLSPLARLYLLYDGRFRDGFHSNGGTLGLEFRW